jgi:hypothetical protein
MRVRGLLPVVMPTRAAAAEAIAAHGVVDVAALDMTTAKASGRGDVGVGASQRHAGWQNFVTQPQKTEDLELGERVRCYE